MEEKEDSSEENAYHIPVLLQESLEALAIKPDGVYVDCTFGGGGHSREILKLLGKEGRLIGFDQDADAQKNLPADDRLVFIPQNFKYLQRFLKLHNINSVDSILADLGVSSHQFDEGVRGFSTRFDGALDMRMDNRETKTAADILNSYSQQELHKIFEKFGEVTNSKTLSVAVSEMRLIQPFANISDFKERIYDLVKGNPQKYFAQVFQALRMEVNEEKNALEEMLTQAVEVLKPGGKLAVITFHSIEDRIVKHFIKNGVHGEKVKDDIYGTMIENPLLIITKKPIVAGMEELKNNKRSRSAKLRVAQKK